MTKVRVYNNRRTTQDLINEERARLDSDFKARLKNAEDSMKQMYPEAYRDIRSKYFGNGNPLGLAGSQYNYIHDIITRNSKNQMQKYYNDLNDYFTKQTGSQAGYMLPEVTVVENADDVNWGKLRNEAIGEIHSENSDYLANVDRQKALDAYYRANQNGVVDVEDKYNRAHQPTKEEQKWNDAWSRAQNSPIVTAMEFSPLFPVVAGAKAAIASSAPDASVGDVAMNAAFAALPAVSKYAYDMYKINKNTLKPIPNLKRIIPESGELNVGSETAGLDKRGDLSFMAYFNMSPRQVMEQIEKDKSLIDVGKKFKVNSLSTDSYPLVLHTMTTKKSPNFNVLYNGKTMQLNNFGNLKGEAAVNRINKKITELNKDRKLAIPLAKLESRPMHQNIEDFYINNEGVAAQIIRNNFKTLDDFKNAYKQSNDVKNLVDGIINSSTERNITVPYLEAIRMYNHGGVLDATYKEQINRIRQPRFAGWRMNGRRPIIKNRRELLDRVNNSGVNFVERMKDANREKYWFDDNNYGTHLMSWATQDGRAVVYPKIQEKNGELVYYQNDKDAIDNAIMNNDVLYMTPREARWFTENYKKYYPEFADGGIHIKEENRGKFTQQANNAGMGVQEFAKHVLANKDNYSSTTIKRANFARNATKFNH